MTVWVVFKNGKFLSVHRRYEYAEETIHRQAFFGSNPDEYEIVPYYI
jgi:hypothetical protein